MPEPTLDDVLVAVSRLESRVADHAVRISDLEVENAGTAGGER